MPDCSMSKNVTDLEDLKTAAEAVAA